VTNPLAAPRPCIGRRRPARLAAPAALLSALAVAACGSGRQADPPAGRSLPPRAVTGTEETARLVDRHAAPPRHISIPAIGMSARVIRLGLNKDRTIQVPTDYSSAGWYRFGPRPGERGPAVIIGHVDNKNGPAVFYRLRELERGDGIVIGRADRSVVRFRIDGLERWPKAEFPTQRVYGNTQGSVLRLVTCSGSFNSSTGHYVDNTIVFASRVSR
jgi:hypothetical protein